MIDIRSLYKPVQPAVTQSANAVNYHEFLPEEKLQPFIYCYWQLRTENILQEQFNYRVVADGCIDIFFELDKPEENFIMGFCRQYTEFPLENTFNYIGVRFLPAMFPLLFKVNAASLSNRFQSLSEVVPLLSQFIAGRFHNGMGSVLIKQHFDNFFLEFLRNIPLQQDNRFYEALGIILENYGVLDIEKGLSTGISPRQLRRLFEFYIGDTAKVFSKVVRFQNILRAKPSSESLRKNKLFFDAGYYDQAHFIKEFKNFYGVTPARAFR